MDGSDRFNFTNNFLPLNHATLGVTGPIEDHYKIEKQVIKVVCNLVIKVFQGVVRLIFKQSRIHRQGT